MMNAGFLVCIFGVSLIRNRFCAAFTKEEAKEALLLWEENGVIPFCFV